MTDIVERLRFDAARCETQFSKGVASNIEEAAAEIAQLRAERDSHWSVIVDAKEQIERLRLEKADECYAKMAWSRKYIEAADKNERLTALLKETRSHVLDAGAAGLVADIDRALEPKP